MQFYDTLAGAKKEFTIPRDRAVTLYVCGVTPYDTTHMGHARTFLVFDTLVRYLSWRGAEVRYCQNVADVENTGDVGRRQGDDEGRLVRPIVRFEDTAGIPLAIPALARRGRVKVFFHALKRGRQTA